MQIHKTKYLLLWWSGRLATPTSSACGFARTLGPPRASRCTWYTGPLLILKLLLLNRQSLLLNGPLLCPHRRSRRRCSTLCQSEKSCKCYKENNVLRHTSQTPCSAHTCLCLDIVVGWQRRKQCVLFVFCFQTNVCICCHMSVIDDSGIVSYILFLRSV